MERYTELKRIGKGSFGTVFLCEVVDTHEKVVMKKIAIDEMTEEEKAAALQEVRVLSWLRHPNIVQYVDSIITESTLCIVMAYCEGGDLSTQITACKKRGKLFPENQILDWFVQLTAAIAYLHERHVLHRDLKTSNVFLNNINMVKLGDFGIARVLDYTQDHAQTVIGTPFYMSPEVCESKPYSYKSDVWSLGCVLYEMCTLQHAFNSSNLLGLVYKIVQETQPPLPDIYSPELKALTAQLLSKDPSLRPHANEIFSIPFIRERLEGLADTRGTIGRRPVPAKSREERLAEKKRLENAKYEEALAESRQKQFAENQAARERIRLRESRPTPNGHIISITSGDSEVLSRPVTSVPSSTPSRAAPTTPDTYRRGSSGEASRAPPARDYILGTGPSSAHSYGDGPESDSGAYFDGRPAWDHDGRRTPTPPRARGGGGGGGSGFNSGGRRPTTSAAAEDRPITASGFYAFEATDKHLPPVARKVSSAAGGSGLPGSPSESTSAKSSPSRPFSSTETSAVAVNGASGSASRTVVDFCSDDEYSDDFDEDDGDKEASSRTLDGSGTAEYGPASQARDEEDADHLVDVLRSFLVQPDGIAEETESDMEREELGATLATNAMTIGPSGAGDASCYPTPASSAAASVRTGTGAGTGTGFAQTGRSGPVASKSAFRAATAVIAGPKPLSRDKRLADMRESIIKELGVGLFEELYDYLTMVRQRQDAGTPVKATEVQTHLKRSVGGDPRLLQVVFRIENLLYEEDMASAK